MQNHPQKLRSWFSDVSRFWLLIIYPSLCTMHQGLPLPVRTLRTGVISADLCCCELWAHPHVHFFHCKTHMPWDIPHGIVSRSWYIIPLCQSHQWNGTSKVASLPTQTSINAAWKTLTDTHTSGWTWIVVCFSDRICEHLQKLNKTTSLYLSMPMSLQFFREDLKCWVRYQENCCWVEVCWKMHLIAHHCAVPAAALLLAASMSW